LKKLLLIFICLPLASQELADVLWGNEKLLNAFNYEQINQSAIDGLDNGRPIAGTLSIKKNAIGKGYKVLVDDKKLYKKSHEDFPIFSIEFASHGGRVYPSNSKILETDHPFWNIQFGIGSSRADNISSDTLLVLPFNLIHKTANCTHSGIGVFFISNLNKISNILFELASETCAYYKFDYIGLLPAQFAASEIKNNQNIAPYGTKENLHNIKPIENLYSEFELNSNSFLNTNYVDPENISIFGVIDGNDHYVSNCDTRLGEFPFCDQILLPSYSLAKSIAGSLSMSLIENQFGSINNLFINDLVPECNQRKWKGVSLNNVSDMATGQYINAIHDRDESGIASVQFIFKLQTHKDKLNKACKAFPRKTKPGRKFVYHTSDTYILGSAMNSFLESNTIYDDYFEDILIPFLIKSNFSQASQSTLKTNDIKEQPYTGWGMFFIRDDLHQISNIMQKIMADTSSNLSFLHEALNPNDKNSLLAIPEANIYYNNGFWSRKFDKSLFNCKEDIWIPFMSGFGGITFAFFPNGMTYYYFSDGYAYAWESAVFSSNSIKPFC